MKHAQWCYQCGLYYKQGSECRGYRVAPSTGRQYNTEAPTHTDNKEDVLFLNGYTTTMDDQSIHPSPLLEKESREDTEVVESFTSSPSPQTISPLSNSELSPSPSENNFLCEHFETKGNCLWKGCVNES